MSYVYLFMNMHRTFSLIHLFVISEVFLYGIAPKHCVKQM